jgi:eukaryotic-like serine/threonine-protein kinase
VAGILDARAVGGVSFRGVVVIGQRVNNYEIVSLLGEGAMGAVYLAQHPFIGRKAAIKVLRWELAQDHELVGRFMNEAKAANAIGHPNIIDIIDVGNLPSGVPYLMMEFLDGESLAGRLLRVGTLPLGEAIEVALKTAGALVAAHAKGIVHRDLKPDNLFLVHAASQPYRWDLRVLDFGVAKLRGALERSIALTSPGALLGTPAYMSPEQCLGRPDEIDERTDVYALGTILYEMLCGTTPFVSAGLGDLVLKQVSEPPRPPREHSPGIPRAVEAVIVKALAKSRDERFGSMRDLQRDLRSAVVDQPTLVAAALPAGRTRMMPGVTVGQTEGDRTGRPGAPHGLLPAPGGTERRRRTSTTLRSAVGEVNGGPGTGTARAGAARSRLWLIGVGGGALAAAAVVMIAVGVRDGEEETVKPPPAAAPAIAAHRAAPPTPPIAPPPAVARERLSLPAPPVAAAEVEERAPAVRVLVESDPPATIVRRSDGRTLGISPLEVEVPPAGARHELVLRRRGYKPSSLTIDRHTAGRVRALLQRTTGDAEARPDRTRGAGEPARAVQPAPPPRDEAPTDPLDDDGLKTPSQF